MNEDRKWVHVTIVDEKDGEEFAWLGADIIRHGVPTPVLVAGTAAAPPAVCLTLTEAQARTLAKRILDSLGAEVDRG